MYGELDSFESHDDQFEHDGSVEWDNWLDEQEEWNENSLCLEPRGSGGE